MGCAGPLSPGSCASGQFLLPSVCVCWRGEHAHGISRSLVSSCCMPRAPVACRVVLMAHFLFLRATEPAWRNAMISLHFGWRRRCSCELQVPVAVPQVVPWIFSR